MRSERVKSYKRCFHSPEIFHAIEKEDLPDFGSSFHVNHLTITYITCRKRNPISVYFHLSSFLCGSHLQFLETKMIQRHRFLAMLQLMLGVGGRDRSEKDGKFLRSKYRETMLHPLRISFSFRCKPAE